MLEAILLSPCPSDVLPCPPPPVCCLLLPESNSLQMTAHHSPSLLLVTPVFTPLLMWQVVELDAKQAGHAKLRIRPDPYCETDKAAHFQ